MSKKTICVKLLIMTNIWKFFVTTSLLTALVLNNAIRNVDSKKYLRCELSRELVEKYQISKTFLSNWICLIEHESDRDTSKKTVLANGETRYGLFQISSKECSSQNKLQSCDTRSYPCCEMKCDDFLNNDISDDVECAKRLFEKKGFRNWNAWITFCRNSLNLPNLKVSCNINTVTPLSRLIS